MSAFSRAARRASGERARGVALEELVGALSDPDAHSGRVDEVQVVEKPLSVLFFAGDSVFELKKPVVLERVDQRTPERRRRACEEELRLNRRISPRMYRGVRRVTRDEDGWIAVEGHGDTIEWVLEMERLPAERMLSALLERGEVAGEQLDAVAAVLARFHERAVTGPTVNRYGVSPAVRARATESVDQLAHVSAACGGVLSGDVLRFLRERSGAFVDEHRDLLERRVAQWRIREGHGDLHAGHVCLADGDVLVYGSAERDPALRCGDVASDLASLAMDIDHRGHPEAAERLVATYADLSSDDELPALLAFYAAHRALMRAQDRLAAAQDETLAERARADAVREARRYVQLAVGYELPPSLILVGDGAAADTARHVAGRLRTRLLRAAGPIGEDGASETMRRTLLEAAVERLDRGGSAVVEGDFARRAARRPYLDAAARLGVRCYVLAPDAPSFESPDPAGAEHVVRMAPDGAQEDQVLLLLLRMIAAA